MTNKDHSHVLSGKLPSRRVSVPVSSPAPPPLDRVAPDASPLPARVRRGWTWLAVAGLLWCASPSGLLAWSATGVLAWGALQHWSRRGADTSRRSV
jgi:hypothetical protein